VKNNGDGFLADFGSVVDAVRCAIEVQRRMVERNVETPPESRIEFRIGINLGDVIVEEHDSYDSIRRLNYGYLFPPLI
jgi:adenylate cyclase